MYIHGPLAQLVEQQTLNLRVEGSIPSRLKYRLIKNGQLVDNFRYSDIITARVVKLADTLDLGSSAFGVRVQIPSLAKGTWTLLPSAILLLARVAQW